MALPSPFRTNLSLKDEIGFNVFKKVNQIPDDGDRFDSSYDMRGFFKENVPGVAERVLAPLLGKVDNNTAQLPDGLHFTDEFKTPFHPTFSEESKFEQPGLKRNWVPNGDGTFSLIDSESGKVVRDERNAFAFPGLLRG